MNLQPNAIYNDYRGQSIDKVKIVELLIDIIENIDNDDLRGESIEILNKIDIKQNRVFKILENILISDLNENLRHAAAKVIINKFRSKALKPFLWALQHESCYNCLITVLKSLERVNDIKVKALLIDEIEKIELEQFRASLSELFLNKLIYNYKTSDLADVLINHATIFSLLKKFKKLKFTIENGLIIKLDFSNIDDLVINWRYRELIQDVTDIIGIQNLKNLKEIEFFPLNWALNNELTYNCNIALIEALERLNNNVAKISLISHIEKIDDKKFVNSINELLELYGSINNISISKLSDILRNFITISYMKKKNPQLTYEIDKAEVIDLHIEGKAIVTLPSFIKNLSSIKKLILKNCNIYNLPETIYTFKNLEILNLEGNNIEILPKNIELLNSLKILNLNKNKLRKLPFSIGRLYKLESLELSDNEISKLPNSIGYISSLKYLDLKGNKLEILPDSIGYIESLKCLILSSNKIKILPESIGLLRSLETLNLEKNLLTGLPTTINLFTSLKFLNLEENKLNSLPESFGTLKSLEILRLGWNKLQSLPQSICELESIRYLYLMNNKLSKLPNSMNLLSSLEDLDVSWNILSHLPESIGKLKSLKILKLNNNQLIKLPETIGFLQSLKILNLDENKLKEIPKSISSLTSLEELWLSSNELESIPEPITNLSLKKLQLNNNKLKIAKNPNSN